jgi:cobalamin biosynthesis Mg chelatase CobN
MDREAYVERRAIMEVEGVDGLTASREASDYAYHTRLGRVATAAANGNWEPAREWCAELAERYGQEAADDLVSDIEANIEAVMAWRR